MKGCFITFEGIENCGKSVQSNLLMQFLESKGKDVLMTREPGGTEISEKIRGILLDVENYKMLPETELLLYAASRVQHTGELILPALNSGKIVISDRYYDSTSAYQGAARKIDGKIIDYLNSFASCQTAPDLTFLIDVEPEVSLERLSRCVKDRIEKEDIEFHKRVRSGFLRLAEVHKKRFRIIDGNQSIQDIHDEIVEIIKKELF
ncbi:MAG: dTMP kinase [Candidatus Cloacimonetes bacterium]|nr:dTMP kinase [Candidatus Cloacimonadota bacterium]